MRPRCGGCCGERGWRHGHGRASGAWGRPSASHERRAWRTIARRTGATQECTTVMSPKGHTAERRRGPGWRSHDSRGPSIRHSLAEVSRAVYHESGNKEIGEEITVANYIPSPRQWVREQVELYEGSGGKEGTTLRDTGLPVIIVTHTGNKTGAIRKTPLMRVRDGTNYVLVGSLGGAPTHPVWVYNLRANPVVELRDHTTVQTMRVREVKDEAERARLWKLAVAAYPPYEEYQAKTTRRIPVFIAEPKRERRS